MVWVGCARCQVPGVKALWVLLPGVVAFCRQGGEQPVHPRGLCGGVSRGKGVGGWGGVVNTPHPPHGWWAGALGGVPGGGCSRCPATHPAPPHTCRFYGVRGNCS